MGERFLAFQYDATVETLLVGAFLALCYWKSSLDLEIARQTALWLIPVAYMTLSEVLFHGTLGKRLLRIQVQADSSEPRYASPFRILLRESIGKFVCGLVLGLGFLAAAWNPKNKTWADRIAGTKVVKIGVVSGGFKALLAPTLIFANLAVGIALAELPARFRSELRSQLAVTEGKVENVHEQILKVFFSHNPQSAEEYQKAVANLPSALDEYGRLLDEEQELVRRSRILFFEDTARLDTYEKVIRLRQAIAVSVRSHVQMVLAYDPQKQTWEEVLQSRHHMMRDISSQNGQINIIGGPYVPRKISFVPAG